jgi:N-acetylmuramoyl-L-alanine amidase
MNSFHNLKALFAFICLLFSFSTYSQSGSKFIVILDAGHGGKDTGAKYNGNSEKDVTLDVTLKVGKILEQNPNITVIYTRKTDVFIELTERAKIANRANANLFISIHCNANKNTVAAGSETYVMGMSRANMNFEVSKSENSVIFLEDNYKQTYKGFDPNNPQTLIGLKMVQENNLTSSIDLATKIQNNFINYEIKSRGVKQEPLWVLDASVMPGVLIEIGFISNQAEANRLISDEGQKTAATAIAKAIIDYKKEFFGEGYNEPVIENPVKINPKNTDTSNDSINKDEKNTNPLSANNNEGIVFKVQIMASNKKIEIKPKNFKGLKNISFVSESGAFFKYMYGATSNYEIAKKNLEEAQKKGYKTAYMLAFKDGMKIDVKDAIK